MSATIVFPKEWVVVMESYGEENSKRVKVKAHFPEDAMAAAQMKYPNWIPVDVEAPQ